MENNYLGRSVMNKEQIEALKALAESATPGPWVAKDSPGAGLEIYADVPAQLGMPSREWPAFSTANADVKSKLIAYETWTQFPQEKLKNVQARNAAYIAAANPAAILDLLASATASEGRIAELTAALGEMIAQVELYAPASLQRVGQQDLWVRNDYSQKAIDSARAALAGSATPSTAPANAAEDDCFDGGKCGVGGYCEHCYHPVVPQDTLKNADSEDAARYRWLTYAGWLDDAVMEAHGIKEGISETLDNAIDAARTAAIESDRATLKEGPCKG
jgi:hypothetical protein